MTNLLKTILRLFLYTYSAYLSTTFLSGFVAGWRFVKNEGVGNIVPTKYGYVKFAPHQK